MSGFAGLAALVIGVFLIAGGPGIWRHAHSAERRARLASGLVSGFLTGLCIASSTLVDGYSVKALLLSPMLMCYLACGGEVSMLFAALLGVVALSLG